VSRHFDVGDIVGRPGPKPLDGVRILALEQMQALPFATQLLGRLGAEVVKVESPGSGDLGRGSLPAMVDPEGRSVGATFLRNNLSKRSIAIDLKSEAGRQLVLDLAPHFDVVAENFRSGAIERLGLGWDDIVAAHPNVVYVSLSGFGHAMEGTGESPYRTWPALAAVVEAMSGIYEMRRPEGQPPVVSPMGAVGDISSALFAVIGLLAALRQRDATGQAQRVDVAMFDVLVAMADIVINFSSLGVHGGLGAVGIMDAFAASDGYVIVQVIREAQWPAFCSVFGADDWAEDDRFATRATWRDRMESDIRPRIEAWAASKTKLEVAEAFTAVGLTSGPCFTDAEVVDDPHLAERHMIVAMERTDGVEDPVLIPGNPIKIEGLAEGPEKRVPWLGEHTDEVLAGDLGLSTDAIAALRAEGVIA
jgi:formyl-CoA transferase